MTAALADELTKHKQAYLQLFKSVLSKRPLDQAGRDGLMRRLSDHMDSVIKTPDDLIPRIPEFAGMLGVNQQTLATFIGTNFLQALQFVQKQAQAQAPAQAAPTAKKSGSFLVDIIHFCPPQLPGGSKFTMADTGFLKLVTPQGEIQSQSFIASGDSGGAVEVNFDAAPAAPVPQTPGAPAAPRAPQAPQRPPSAGEKSILQEMLERFGSSIDIPGKLVVRDYGSDEPDDEEVPEEEEAPVAAAPGAPVPVKATTPQPAARREVSILKELLDKFGNVIDIPEKLVPRSFADENAEDDSDSDEEEIEETPMEAQPVFETPVPFTFTNYLDALKRLQDFQTTQDQDGYRKWLSTVATLETKVLVAVRNFEKKEKAGMPVNWADEYYGLGNRLGAQGNYIGRVHRHLKRLANVHAIWNGLMQVARTAAPPQMEDLKRLWPQIKLLFDEGGTESALNSRLQILMLAIPDPGRKDKLKSILSPYLKQLANLN